MSRPIVTYVGKIDAIQDRRDLILVTDYSEVVSTLERIGYPVFDDTDPIEFSGLFVLVGDGDYEEMYGFEGTVPYLIKSIWKIDNQSIADN